VGWFHGKFGRIEREDLSDGTYLHALELCLDIATRNALFVRLETRFLSVEWMRVFCVCDINGAKYQGLASVSNRWFSDLSSHKPVNLRLHTFLIDLDADALRVLYQKPNSTSTTIDNVPILEYLFTDTLPMLPRMAVIMIIAL